MKCMLSWKADVYKIKDTVKVNLHFKNLTSLTKKIKLPKQFHLKALFKSEALNDLKEIITSLRKGQKETTGCLAGFSFSPTCWNSLFSGDASAGGCSVGISVFFLHIFYFSMFLLVFGFYRLWNAFLNISFSNVNLIWNLQVSLICKSSQRPPRKCPCCVSCPQVSNCSGTAWLQCHPRGSAHGCLFRQGRLFLVALIPCMCFIHDLVSCTWSSKCFFGRICSRG